MPKKYSWFQDPDTSRMLPYTVIHKENGIDTNIAFTDTAEKADVITKALNSFHEYEFSKKEPFTPVTFEEDLAMLINKHSKENESDTHDFVLASFLTGAMELFSKTIKQARPAAQGK